VLGVTLLAAALGGVFLTIAEPTYEIRSRLLVEQRGMPLEQVTADPDGAKEFLATQAEVIRSPAVVRRAVEKLGLTVSVPPGVDPVIAILEELRVAPVLGTSVLTVQYNSPFPEEAERTVKQIIESYGGYLREHEEDSQVEAIRLLTRSEKELREDLERRQSEYLKLREESPLLGGQGRDAVAVQLGNLTHLAETLHSVTHRRLELSTLLEAMRQANKVANAGESEELQLVALHDAGDDSAQNVPVKTASLSAATLVPRFGEESMPPDLAAVQQELSKARSHLQQLASQYGSRHPAVAAARAEADAWNDRLKEHLESAPTTIKQELAALAHQEQQVQALYESELSKAKSVDSYLIREQQALDGISRVQGMHSSLLGQLQQWQLTEQALADGRSRVTLRVLEEPVAPLRPTWPVPKLVLAISIILGFFGGVGLALLLGSERTPSVQQLTVGVPQRVELDAAPVNERQTHVY
jgi:uncharacterized protein involved in exopolysaccharide biosynthesis